MSELAAQAKFLDNVYKQVAAYDDENRQLRNRIKALKVENSTLRQQNAELVEAFKALMEGLYMENIDRALNESPEMLKAVGCKIAEAAKRGALIWDFFPQPCGHPRSAIVSSDEGTCYCGECAKEAEE